MLFRQYASNSKFEATSSSPRALPSIMVLTRFGLKQLAHRLTNWLFVMAAKNSFLQL